MCGPRPRLLTASLTAASCFGFGSLHAAPTWSSGRELLGQLHQRTPQLEYCFVGGRHLRRGRQHRYCGVSADLRQLVYSSYFVDKDRQWAYYVAVNGREFSPGEKLLTGRNDQTIWFGPQGRRFAFAIRDAGRWRVVVDGQSSRSFAYVRDLRFSPEGSRFAYVAGVEDRGGRVRAQVFVDGRGGAAYDHITGLVFSRDGRAFAYLAKQDGQSRVVVNHVVRPEVFAEDPGAQSIRRLLRLKLNADGSQVAFLSAEGSQYRVHLNGRRSSPHYGIDFRFAPRGNRYAYTAALAQRVGPSQPGVLTPSFTTRWLLAVDGTRIAGSPAQPLGTAGRRFLFSPDGRRLAYVLKAERKQRVVLDGNAHRAYHLVGQLQFSVDSRRFAYVAKVAPLRWAAIVDGQEGPPFRAVSRFRFSESGGHFGYRAAGPDGFHAVHDHRVSPAYRDLGRIILSSDGKRSAYSVGRLDQPGGFVVVDGKRWGHGPGAEGMLASGTNRWLFVRWTPDGKAIPITDGHPGPQYDRIREASFSPDGRFLAYVVHRGATQRVIVQGRPGPPFRTVIAGPRFSANSDGLLYLAVDRDRRLWRIRIACAIRCGD